MSGERVAKPWGWYQVLAEGEGYLVKLLHLEPGQQLSLQRHRHREERWVVAYGDALVESEGLSSTTGRGALVAIHPGATHRLSAFGDGIPLEVIEVQLGDDLREDDIERIEDRYGRAPTGAHTKGDFGGGPVTTSCACGCGGVAGVCDCARCRESGWLSSNS